MSATLLPMSGETEGFIREARSDDQPALEALLALGDLSVYGLLAPESRYWLASGPEGVLGTVGLEYGPRAVLLRSAVVHPQWRNRGLGAALVRTALGAAAAQVPDVYLFSTGAGPYWQRFGFVEVPVSELVDALPNAPQVRYFADKGWLPDEVAWRCPVMTRDP